MIKYPLILASQSPRRKHLLESAGISPIVSPAHIEEKPKPQEDPKTYVLRNALEKTHKKITPEAHCLAADTVVVREGHILEKPEHKDQAFAMLRTLSGKKHHVHTGVHIVGPHGTERSWVTTTEVQFVPLSDDQIYAYIETGEPYDKAGGYGIQARGAFMVQSLVGSYTNVVGLPLAETIQNLIALESQPV